jgi:hypothetical protein
MKIKYRKVDDHTRPEGHTFVPLLRVFVRHGSDMRPTLMLVDSGAADCVFPASFGEVLGIDIPSGEPHNFHGFDLTETRGFLHNVHLQVMGFNNWIEVRAAFIESEAMPVLGQSGFFENYQIIFERFKRQFEVNTKVDAIIRNKRGHGRVR